MSDRTENPPQHPRRRAVVPPFLPPRSTGGDQRAQQQVRARPATPPFTPPHARRAIVAEPFAPVLAPEPLPSVPSLEELDRVDPRKPDEGKAHGDPLAARAAEPEIAKVDAADAVTDWLEDEAVGVGSAIAGQEAVEDRIDLMQPLAEAEQQDANAEWPAEAWHASEPAEGTVAAAGAEEAAPDDPAAPVTPFDFAAEFPRPEAFTSAIPAVGEGAHGAPWVAPSVQPLEMGPGAVAVPFAAGHGTPLDSELQALERLKATEPWAVAGAPPPAQSMPATSAVSAPGDVIANALERIARRIRGGEVVLPDEGLTATDEAALALTLAALL
ncbi:MAG: hypothetical protein ACREON_03510, partial [Gemmatimonadaceae bacterium]